MSEITTRPVLFTVEIINSRGPNETHTLRARVEWNKEWNCFEREAIERAIERAVKKARPGARRCWVPDLSISPDQTLVRESAQPGESRTQYGHIGRVIPGQRGGGTSLDYYARVTAQVL